MRFSLRECQCTCVKTSHFCKKKEISIFQELNLNLKNQSINDDELGFEINGIKCSSILVRANIGEIEGFMAMRKSPRVQIIFSNNYLPNLFMINSLMIQNTISLQKKIMMLLCATAVGCILIWYLMTTFYNPFA